MGFNNKLGTLHKIIEFYTEFFSVCPNITSTFFTVNMFKSFVEENIDSNKICRHVHGISRNVICLIVSDTLHKLSS